MIDQRFLDRLLTAEPHELRGEGESDVARRVRLDPAARDAADRILVDMHAMDSALADIESATAHGAAAPTLTATSGNTASGRLLDPIGAQPVRRQLRTRRVFWPLGLAAAAAAALLIARTDMPFHGTRPAEPASQAPSSGGLADGRAGGLADDNPAPEPPLTATLGVESDRRFAVFATDNPNIAVVWLFDDQEGQ